VLELGDASGASVAVPEAATASGRKPVGKWAAAAVRWRKRRTLEVACAPEQPGALLDLAEMGAADARQLQGAGGLAAVDQAHESAVAGLHEPQVG
jgi:hypothetical protein